jgi:pimeloyl-ACP methyl ester carboxylesterase
MHRTVISRPRSFGIQRSGRRADDRYDRDDYLANVDVDGNPAQPPPVDAFEIQGHRIALMQRGDASESPVVCVHSTGLSSLQWRRLARRLAPRSVLAPDLIGYGGSDDWRGDRPFETAADLAVVEHVFDLCGDRPIHVVGHSYGGRLALLAAARRPDRVRSLSLFEPVSFGVLASSGDRAGLDELARYDDDGTFLDDAIGGTEAWVERFVDYWNGAGAWRELSDNQRGAFMRSSRKMFEEVRETCRDSVPHTEYVGLDVPALFISGSESTLAGRRVCAVLARELPQGRHVEIEGGHMAPLMMADVVNPLIIDHVHATEAR